MISGKMYRFRVPGNHVDPRYIEAFLQSSAAREAIDGMKTGGSDSGLNLTHQRFRRLRVPLPPHAEQKRIVEKYEELVSELDAGVESIERVREKLKLYRTSVLKAAVQGALTADWRLAHPESGPARDYLRRILVERRRRWEERQLAKYKANDQEPPANWKHKYPEPAPVDDGAQRELPNQWCWATVDQLIREPLRNGHSAKKTGTDDGIPTFTLSAVTEGDFSKRNIKGTVADAAKVHDLWVETNDIFVQRSNTPELVGTTRRYSGEAGRAIFPDLLIRIRVSKDVDAAFVEIALRSLYTHSYFRWSAQGISGSMPKIDQEVVGRAAIPLPSLAEQRAIVEAVEDQLSVIDHLEIDLRTKLKSTHALRQAVLRDAFAGQLVLQDPSDEPASELLKRIQAKREALKRADATAPTKRRPRKRARTARRKRRAN